MGALHLHVRTALIFGEARRGACIGLSSGWTAYGLYRRVPEHALDWRPRLPGGLAARGRSRDRPLLPLTPFRSRPNSIDRAVAHRLGAFRSARAGPLRLQERTVGVGEMMAEDALRRSAGCLGGTLPSWRSPHPVSRRSPPCGARAVRRSRATRSLPSRHTLRRPPVGVGRHRALGYEGSPPRTPHPTALAFPGNPACFQRSGVERSAGRSRKPAPEAD